MLFICCAILSFSFKFTEGITNGRIVETEKRFVVYLLAATNAIRNYSGWVCGGAIITPLNILTSASCAIDVQHVYVVSGYKKYVPGERAMDDECIVRKRRRIIRTCTPTVFDRSTNGILGRYREMWSYADITVATVDKAFDFYDNTYYEFCNYPPSPIEINFLDHYTEPGTSVLMYGWGHIKYRRPDFDLTNYNEKYMRYSSSKTTSRDYCERVAPKVFYYLAYSFRKFFTCVLEHGNIDERGDEIVGYNDILDDCGSVFNDSLTYIKSLHGRPIKPACMKHILRMEATKNDPDLVKVPGICQNDHGGPVTTFRGGREVLVGVAATYTLTKRLECRAPFSFSATHCFNRFIACMIYPEYWMTTLGRRSSMNCDKMSKFNGYYNMDQNVSWADHPDPPVVTEQSRRSGPLNYGYDNL